MVNFMNAKLIAKTGGGQDGAVFGKLLFRLNHKGDCRVYDMAAIASADGALVEPFTSFVLDRADEIVPHSNSVVFGREYYAEGDEFPLLYSNIYNNYAKTDAPMKGVCCVYRLERDGDGFKTTLVQLIEIGFVEDAELWKMSREKDGARPYGNFVVDVENGKYCAYVMRSEELGTRYFVFDLPKLQDGGIDEKYGVKRVVLTPNDIEKQFDCPEHHYIQGACCHAGKVYSVEGFRNNPALRIVDLNKGEQELFFNFSDVGITDEAEFIDFYCGSCYYGDCHGNIYLIEA